ncbi:MAG: hypothetical protein ACK4NO_01715 [Glycocaulis sp.]
MARRGSPHDLQRLAARARRVRRPHEAGLARRVGWYGWRLISSLARPALFAGLIFAAGWTGFAGLQALNTGAGALDRQTRISQALASLTPDAPSAAALWAAQLDAAMRPRRNGPPDTELAVSLAHAFEDLAGRERFASYAWGEARGLEPPLAEAALRAQPVWLRARELELVWHRALAGGSAAHAQPPALSLAPETVRVRVERARRLFPVIDQTSAAFFAGHETGAFNLATLPGLPVEGELWMLPDAQALNAHCSAQEDAVACMLARIGTTRDRAGTSPAAAQGARLFRAGLAGGIVTPGLAGQMAALDRQALEALSAEMARAARYTSNITALRLMAYLHSPDDVVRLRLVAEAAGPRTLALFQLMGRDALGLAGEAEGVPVMTRAALEHFIAAALIALLACGMVASAIVSAARVSSSRRAGLGQRLDIAARELLLGRKS